MQELTDLPDFRRFNGSTAYIEGWGLYTERLSEEMGLLSGETDRFGVLSFDAWRAARLVVDTGIHALGWTRQQAIDFMAAHTALGLNNVPTRWTDTSPTPARPSPTSSDSWSCSACAPRRVSARATDSTSGASTTPSWAMARFRCPCCARSSSAR